MSNRTKPLAFGQEAMSQYTAIGNELRFYTDQRFKIAGAFLVANSLLANVAKDYKSMSLAIIGVLLSLLCALWDKRTTDWWRSLLESLRCNESAGVQEGKLALAYRRYKYCDRTGWEKLTSPSKAI